ncbi:hypothetical protein LUZ60_016742 [Juncus effusus]|nr:hypothetical protein LUZ60_016742 [Juncus effusus]
MTYMKDSFDTIPLTQDELLLDKLEVIKIQGLDKSGRLIVRIVGKFYPAKVLKGEAGEDALKGYIQKKILPELEKKKSFVIVYVHSCVNRGENFPGLAVVRSVSEMVPESVIDKLHAIYFLHPGLQSRLFFATIGRFTLSPWMYEKLRYISRVEFLKAYMAKGEIEMPDFVKEHDGKLEKHPFLDYGFVTTNPIDWDNLDYKKSDLDDLYDDYHQENIIPQVPRVSAAF